MSNYPAGANTKSAPWNRFDGHINDGVPKVFRVQVELIIEASTEDEMEDAMEGIIQGGVVDYDNQMVLSWRHK